MKRLITILFILLSLVASSQHVRRYLGAPTQPWGRYVYGWNCGGCDHITCNPGDTLVIRTTDGWIGKGLGLDGFRGTITDSIVIINEGSGQTRIGSVELKNCQYLKFVGIGSDSTFGFWLDGGFSGMDIDGRSAWIEISNVKFTNVGYIIRAKQDGNCADSLNYPNWHMDGIKVHDIWARGINQDGLYFGNTAPTDPRAIGCPENAPTVTLHPVPMRLSNIEIYNCYIDSCGRTGMQLSGCDSGFQNIHDNIITRTGYELNPSQGSGWITGGMASNVHFHHNTIRYTFNAGIIDEGIGLSNIEYNDIDFNGLLPIPQFDKQTLVNTDNSYHYISSGGAIIPLSFKIMVTRNSGTAGGIAFIMGSPDGITYTPISDTFVITNTVKQTHLWNLPGINSRYWKAVVQTTGTQNIKAEYFIVNLGYPFSIGVNAYNTLPANLTHTVWIRNNTVGDSDIYNNGYNNGYNIVTGALAQPPLWTNANIICNNFTQGGTPATVNNLGGITYSTDCSGANQLPIVYAGANQTVTLPTSSVTLTGSATDVDGTIVSYLWTRLSGPNTPTIVSPTAQSTSVTGLIQGVYVFRLAATDNNAGVGYSTTQVTVVVTGNIAPTANAGTDQIITLPVSSTTLTGSGNDPDGTISAYLWQYVSGPNVPTIVTPATASTSVTGMIQGAYVFKLTVTDNNGAIGTDNISVTVNPAPGNNKYWRRIVVDHTKVPNTTQTDFPVLVSETLVSLRTIANGGRVENANGYDIRFTSDSAGSIIIPFEIEKYNSATGELVAWVKRTLSPSVNDTFYITYGDPTITAIQNNSATWNDFFVGVYHMDDFGDATKYANNGIPNGTTIATGKIGSGKNFNGTSDYIKLGTSGTLGITGNISMRMWIKVTDFANFNGLIGKTLYNQPNPYDWYLIQSSGLPQYFRGDGIGDNSNVTGSAAPTAGVWQFMSVVISDDQCTHYLNGNTNGSAVLTNPNITNGAGDVIVGSRNDLVTMFKGLIDEVRISNTALSADWIKTEYNNQNSPSTFYSIGSEITFFIPKDFRLKYKRFRRI